MEVSTDTDAQHWGMFNFGPLKQTNPVGGHSGPRPSEPNTYHQLSSLGHIYLLLSNRLRSLRHNEIVVA